MLMQWIITMVLVLACSGYAIKALLPIAGKAGRADTAACSGGCKGCGGAAAQHGCATPAGVKPLTFHPPVKQKI